MPCYHPLEAWRSARVNPTGRHSISFNPKDSNPYNPHSQIKLPCGQCIGCRLERSRQWAIRCVHEAETHKENAFVTLTYDDKYNPGTLVLRDFQLFMKRLRKCYGAGIRFFHCGEYGEQLERPHYHALLFGFQFSDRALWSQRGDVSLYRSGQLEKLWPFGFSTVGDATFESAAYVARYIVKKVTGSKASEHYLGRKPEYVTMSRRPGIGTEWFRRFKSDVYPRDEVVIRNGVVCRPPKFYDKLFESEEVYSRWALKLARQYSTESSFDCTPRRLIQRGEVKDYQSKLLTRGFENGAA